MRQIWFALLNNSFQFKEANDSAGVKVASELRWLSCHDASVFTTTGAKQLADRQFHLRAFRARMFQTLLLNIRVKALEVAERELG
jgi:hypothetical protein